MFGRCVGDADGKEWTATPDGSGLRWLNSPESLKTTLEKIGFKDVEVLGMVRPNQEQRIQKMEQNHQLTDAQKAEVRQAKLLRFSAVC